VHNSTLEALAIMRYTNLRFTFTTRPAVDSDVVGTAAVGTAPCIGLPVVTLLVS